ncbi:MAG: hypothetical protein WC723_02130 [Candidatus Omnitrophota bacterium]
MGSNNLRFIKGATIFAIIMLVLPTAKLANAYNLEEYYPLADNSSWEYSIIRDGAKEEVTLEILGDEKINNSSTIKQGSPEDYSCIVIDPEGIKIYKEAEGDYSDVYDPPMVIFPNINESEEKAYSGNLISYDKEAVKQGSAQITSRIILENKEKISVPAGEFSDCLKFASSLKTKEENGNHSSEDCSIWLASGVGKVKAFCIVTEYEADTKKESTSIKIYELISAIVNGKKIGSQ